MHIKVDIPRQREVRYSSLGGVSYSIIVSLEEISLKSYMGKVKQDVHRDGRYVYEEVEAPFYFIRHKDIGKDWVEIEGTEYKRIEMALMRLNLAEVGEHNKKVIDMQVPDILGKRICRSDLNALFGIELET